MKFPKIPKIIKKNLVVVYVIIFLLIASVLVYVYFYGSFRENAVTLTQAQQDDLYNKVKVSAQSNINDAKQISGNIILDVNNAKIPTGNALPSDLTAKIIPAFAKITSDKSANDTNRKIITGNTTIKANDPKIDWLTPIASAYGSAITKIPGCDMSESEKKIRQTKDPSFKSLACPIK